MTSRCLALDSPSILRPTCRCSGKCLGLFFNRDGIACKSSPGTGLGFCTLFFVFALFAAYFECFNLFPQNIFENYRFITHFFHKYITNTLIFQWFINVSLIVFTLFRNTRFSKKIFLLYTVEGQMSRRLIPAAFLLPENERRKTLWC